MDFTVLWASVHLNFQNKAGQHAHVFSRFPSTPCPVHLSSQSARSSFAPLSAVQWSVMLLLAELLQNRTGASFVCLNWLRGGDTGNSSWIINESATALTDYYSQYSNQVAPGLLVLQWSARNLWDFVNSGASLGAGGAREAVNKNKGARLRWIAAARLFLRERCVRWLRGFDWGGWGCCSRGPLLTFAWGTFSLEAQQSNLSIHWWAALRVSVRATWNRSFLSLQMEAWRKTGFKRKYKRRGGGIRRWSHFRC